MPLLIEPTCLVCGASIRTDNPYRLYCSNACRQAAYRAKAATPRQAPVHKVRNKTQRTTRHVLDRQQAARDRRRNGRTRTKAKRPQDPRTKRTPNKRRRPRSRK